MSFWIGWAALLAWLAIDPGWHQHAQDVAYRDSLRTYLEAPAGRCHWTADPHRQMPAALCFQRGALP